MAKLKLTDEKQTFIVNALKAGNYCDVAAKAAGLSESTFWRYMEMGERVSALLREAEEDPEVTFKPTQSQLRMLDFWEAVTRARAEAEVQAVAMLRKAMPEDWRAAMAYLERAFPKRWGLRKPGDGTDEVELTQAQAALIVQALRTVFDEVGVDANDPHVRSVMRDALESAGGGPG